MVRITLIFGDFLVGALGLEPSPLIKSDQLDGSAFSNSLPSGYALRGARYAGRHSATRRCWRRSRAGRGFPAPSKPRIAQPRPALSALGRAASNRASIKSGEAPARRSTVGRSMPATFVLESVITTAATNFGQAVLLPPKV